MTKATLRGHMKVAARVALGSLLLGAPPVARALVQDTLCFPWAGGVPFGNAVPQVDGVVRKDPGDGAVPPKGDDLGWTGAYQYLFSDGSSVPKAIFQAVRGSLQGRDTLFLSMEVAGDAPLDHRLADAISVAFQVAPSGTPDRYWRFNIFPFSDPIPPSGDNLTPTLEIWRGSDGANGIAWTKVTAQPAWIVAMLRRLGGNVDRWSVEVSIGLDPSGTNGIAISAADFGAYVALLDDKPSGTEPWQWPPSAPPPQDPDFGVYSPNYTPASSTWGTGLLSQTGCGGLSITWASITTNQPNPAQIDASPTGSNVFHVQVASTLAAPVSGVEARLRIANFGPNYTQDLAKAWEDIPVSPTAAGTIPANGSAPLSTASWTLNQTWRDRYAAIGGMPHQCILAELSAPPGTTFVNRSAYRNMDFFGASGFETRAFFNGPAFGAPPEGTVHQFELEWFPTVRLARAQGEIATIPKGTLVAELDMLVRTRLPTGKTITMRGESRPLKAHAGSYLHVVQHPIPAELARLIDRIPGEGRDVRLPPEIQKRVDDVIALSNWSYEFKDGSSDNDKDKRVNRAIVAVSQSEMKVVRAVGSYGGCGCRRVPVSGYVPAAGLLLFWPLRRRRR